MAFERPRQQLRNLGNEEKHKFVMNILITPRIGGSVCILTTRIFYSFVVGNKVQKLQNEFL